MVSSEIYSIKSLILKASQGTLENIDKVQNGFFGLTNLKVGEVIISVFRQCDTGLQILNKQSFKVINRPLTIEQRNTLKLTCKPTISIGGFTDSIPLDVLINATKIDVDSTLRIEYAVLRLYERNLKSDTDIIVEGGELVLYANEFDEYLKKALKAIKPNSNIGIELYNIKVMDSVGKVYALKPVHFKVVD